MAQSPSLYEVGEFYVAPVSRAWLTTGNTDTVTDESITAGSMVLIENTSVYAGRWYISNITPTSSSTNAQTGVTTITPGTFTVTSSSSETQTTTTYKYQLA